MKSMRLSIVSGFYSFSSCKCDMEKLYYVFESFLLLELFKFVYFFAKKNFMFFKSGEKISNHDIKKSTVKC